MNNNYLVKLKNELRLFRKNREKLIESCEEELTFLSKTIEEIEHNINLSFFEKIISKFNSTSKTNENCYFNNLVKVRYFCSPDESIDSLIVNSKNGDKQAFNELCAIYNKFKSFTQYLIENVKNLQYFINAYENTKVKAPIPDIRQLFEELLFTNLSYEEISKIIGMTIVFNSRYASKNKEHSIKNIDIITKLTEYYNEDGTFKHNEDIASFEYLFRTLTGNGMLSKEKNIPLFGKYRLIDASIFGLALSLSNFDNKKASQVSVEDTPKHQSVEEVETRPYLQGLSKYYKNGDIIAIPEDLDKFYQELEQSGLDIKEIKHIKKLIAKKIENRRIEARLGYLKVADKAIYKKAVELLATLNNYESDAVELKKCMEELHVVFDELEKTTDGAYREYLLGEIPKIIRQMAVICDKYNVIDDTSTNRYIFLLNKDGNPYIYEDLNLIDVSYNSELVSLIKKIVPANVSQFKKHYNYDGYNYKYKMYGLLSSNIHIAFVEVDAGIYVLVGVGVRRSGYTELNNRLKANQDIIQQFERAVKDPSTRNELLKEHEIYLDLVITDKKNKQPRGKIKSLVNNSQS